MEEFNIFNINLEGNKIIEASAGTGKTYSISLLALRILLEKNLDIRKIVVVTFTKKAAAELKERIFFFINKAKNYLTNNIRTDKEIEEICNTYANDSSTEVLNDALINFDETSIFTIHSFCQKIITEFAFETGALFELETVPDQGDFIKETAYDYWRKTILNKNSGRNLNYIPGILNPDKLLSLAGDFLRHTGISIYEVKSYNFQKPYRILEDIISIWKKDKDDIITILSNSKILKQNQNAYSKDFIEKVKNKLVFDFNNKIIDLKVFERLTESSVKKNLKKNKSYPYHYFFEKCEELVNICYCNTDKYKYDFLQFLKKELVKKKIEKNSRAFDDLILTIYNILKNKNY